VEVRVEQGELALRSFDRSWDELVARQPLANPTLSSTWLREMATWDAREVPLVITVWSGPRLLAGGAFALRTSNRAPVTVATWPGGYGPPLLQPDILVDPERPEQGAVVIGALLDRVRAAILVRTPRQGATVRAVAEAAPWAKAVDEQGEGWVLDLPPAALSRRARQVAYEQRRAARHGARIDVEVRRDEQGVVEALDRLLVLHKRRWANRDDDLSRFSRLSAEQEWHRRAVAEMVRGKRAIVAEVFEDDRLVGSMLVLLAGRSSLFYTMAVATDGVLRGPGHVAILAAIDAAHEKGATTLHLGRGTGAHKLRWRPTPVQYTRFAVAPSPGQQRLLTAALGVDGALSPLVQRSLSGLRRIGARPR
jgi:hypothetical protein